MRFWGILISIKLLLIAGNTCIAQNSLLSVPISYKAHEQSIGKILKDLEKKTPARFTYNSSLINTEQHVSIDVTNETLGKTLNLLFDNKFAFQQINSQIIITPKKNAPTQNNVQKKPPPQTRTQTRTQTPLQDTIFVYDTIQHIQYDTLRYEIYDTTYIIDSSKYYRSQKLRTRNKSSVLNFSALSGNYYSIPIFWNTGTNSYSQEIQKAETTGQTKHHSILIQYLNRKSSYGIGIEYMNYTYTANFTTENTHNETTYFSDTLWYWQYELLFSYYKYVPGQDSVFIPVYDSTYTYSITKKPKKTESSTQYNTLNSYTYIGIPFSYAYRHFFTENIELQTSVSFTPLFLITSKGSLPGTNNTTTDLHNSNILKKINYSLTLSGNFLYYINKYYSIHIKPTCRYIPTLMKKDLANFQKSTIHFGIEWGASYTIPYSIPKRLQIF
ncbi:MAG: STN domain-containing protein [Bacteroidales bacterium]